jgi:hypothetical protein
MQDEYTFLERGKGSSFMQKIDEHFEAHIRQLNPEAFDRFKPQVLNAEAVYNTAVATQQRTVAERTVPACHRCNLAMNRMYEHSMAVYRCFNVTAASESPLLETRTNVAHSARKVVQQIGLYFMYDGTTWRPKPGERMLLEAAMWRCIAFLFSWGRAPSGSGVRLRLIALFYASFYIHAKFSSLKKTMPFEVPFESI